MTNVEWNQGREDCRHSWRQRFILNIKERWFEREKRFIKKIIIIITFLGRHFLSHTYDPVLKF